MYGIITSLVFLNQILVLFKKNIVHLTFKKYIFFCRTFPPIYYLIFSSWIVLSVAGTGTGDADQRCAKIFTAVLLVCLAIWWMKTNRSWFNFKPRMNILYNSLSISTARNIKKTFVTSDLSIVVAWKKRKKFEICKIDFQHFSMYILNT